MITAIAAHTVRLHMRSGALALTCAVLTLLLGIAAFASWRHQRQVQAERERFNATVRTQWLQQPDRHPHRVSHYGYLAFRDRSPLSFFDTGIDSYAGTAIFLEAHRQNPANFSEAGQSAVAIRLGELTPALVLQLIVPLLIFFLGFSSISSEREQGTWPIILAQGVSARELMIGKTLGLMTVAALVVTPGLLACGATLQGGASPQRIALLLGTYGGYFVVCTLLTVLVSWARPSSRAALSSLVLLWVFAFVILPRALQSWGAAAAPSPSRAAFDARLEADLEDAGDSHNPDDPHFAELRARVLARHGVKRVQDLPFNYSAFVMKEAEQISSAAFERRYGELMETFEGQGRPIDIGGWINPYLAVRRISMALSGTDLRHFSAFQRQAEAFRFSMIQKLNDIHLNEIRAQDDRMQRASRSRWSEFPEFRYQPPDLRAILAAQWPAMLSLGIWLGVLTLAVVRCSAK